MSIVKPYNRNCRPFSDGDYTEGGRAQYITHQKYAESPIHYIRAFLLIQKDLQSLFDYIEPDDLNEQCYSYRIHGLLLRTCVEIEANFKAILRENNYKKKKERDWNITCYKKINVTHRLSSYKIKLPIWTGEHSIRTPFEKWKSNESLSWYQAYNNAKHDRKNSFKEANFKHLIDAVCGLLTVLSAQFHTTEFSSGPILIATEGGYHHDNMESAIGEYFRIAFPNDWPKDDLYNFDWTTLKTDPEPFQQIDYNDI